MDKQKQRSGSAFIKFSFFTSTLQESQNSQSDLFSQEVGALPALPTSREGQMVPAAAGTSTHNERVPQANALLKLHTTTVHIRFWKLRGFSYSANNIFCNGVHFNPRGQYKFFRQNRGILLTFLWPFPLPSKTGASGYLFLFVFICIVTYVV